MRFKVIVEEGDASGVAAVRALVEIEPDSGEDVDETKNNESDLNNLGYNFGFDEKDNNILRKIASFNSAKEF